MDDPTPRHIDVESVVADMRPPTDDDVPMTLDWEPLDTKEKLLAYLAGINESRERDQSNSGCSVAPPVAPHSDPNET